MRNGYTKGNTKGSESVMGKAIAHNRRLSAPSPSPVRAAAPAAAPALPPAAAPAPGAHAAAGQTLPAQRVPRASAPPETSCKSREQKAQAWRRRHDRSTKAGGSPSKQNRQPVQHAGSATAPTCKAWCSHRLGTACRLQFRHRPSCSRAPAAHSRGTPVQAPVGSAAARLLSTARSAADLIPEPRAAG